MKFVEVCKALALNVAALFSSSPLVDNLDSQPQHLLPLPHHVEASSSSENFIDFPRFNAPSGPDKGNFLCEYPDLGPDWESCSTPTNRQCWLRNKKNGTEYNIKTDYENIFPMGKLREYILDVGPMNITADGVTNSAGKVFNQTYPGPWIQACWGDRIKVTVRNKLHCNGTSIHWHGLRQLNTVEMDGVNGVTECPIKPGDQTTYEFRAMQYGTTWYHSHYSLQYADGLAGPITVFGPASAGFDEAHDPILITDWGHNSAFSSYIRELTGKPGRPMLNSVLINGTGNFAGLFNNKKFEMVFKQGKKYLLRIINTSVDTSYIFSIDNHKFTVISSDFVPIKPYVTDHVSIGIGQRYHIILDATPIPTNDWLSPTGDYWLRAVAADGCKAFEPGNEPDERQGVVKYNASSTAVPISWRPDYDTSCRDEPYDKLVPILPWKISRKRLPPLEEWFEVGLQPLEGRPEKHDKFSFWTMASDPIWLSYNEPTIFDLDNTTWTTDKAIIPLTEKADEWVFLVLTMPPPSEVGDPDRTFIPTAHPIHLHGHDFALIAQGTDRSKLPFVPLKLNNPPRRDVALLPSGGYLIMGFKADNPGMWLIHCHIAWHASSGLGMIVLEREDDLKKLLTEERLKEPRRVCENWREWYVKNAAECVRPPGSPFQDDSGI